MPEPSELLRSGWDHQETRRPSQREHCGGGSIGTRIARRDPVARDSHGLSTSTPYGRTVAPGVLVLEGDQGSGQTQKGVRGRSAHGTASLRRAILDERQHGSCDPRHPYHPASDLWWASRIRLRGLRANQILTRPLTHPTFACVFGHVLAGSASGTASSCRKGMRLGGNGGRWCRHAWLFEAVAPGRCIVEELGPVGAGLAADC